MAHQDHKGYIDSLKAASAVQARKLVALDTVDNQIVPIGTNNVRPYGQVDASGAQGEQLTVYGLNNVVKVVAAASVGHGAEVGVASTNGDIGPIAGASGITRWSAGVTRSAAAAGEVLSLYVQPRQLSNLI
ncbi:MAG TPA: hypothetical protein VK506_01450 [Conexibacter sp.]|nr:hypothetical protein [Conexibacter sp.]